MAREDKNKRQTNYNYRKTTDSSRVGRTVSDQQQRRQQRKHNYNYNYNYNYNQKANEQ